MKKKASYNNTIPKEEKVVITADEEVEEASEEPVEEVEVVIEEAPKTEAGVVIAKMLNVRPDPSMSKDPLRILYEGDKVEYTIENDEWYKLVDGGYVMAKHIQ